MDRQEFINGLRRNLSGMEDYEYINETVRYYENYIDTEVRKGETEEAVLRMLGDPGLIAKSIKASRGEVGATVGVDAAVYEEQDRGANFKTGLWEKFFAMPSWAIKATAISVAVVVIILLGLILSWLLPVIVVGVVAYLFYKFVKDNFLK